MFKLLRNYLRDQKNNLLQMLGLGFLVIIMITAFLALNFATNFISSQFYNKVATNGLHQAISFDYTNDYSQRKLNYWSTKPFTQDTWLNNLDYYTKDGDIKGDILKKATFELSKDKDKDKDTYTLTFYKPKDRIYSGENLWKETQEWWIKFTINRQIKSLIPKDFFDNILPKYANGNINYWLTSQKALNYYNKNILPGTSLPKYSSNVVGDENTLYQIIVSSMLYNNNLELKKEIIVNDLIMTGKRLAFVQIPDKNSIVAPIKLVDTPNFDISTLKDNEILIYKDFANENNLKIGDKFAFAGKEFTIRGFATNSFAFAKGYYFGHRVDSKNTTVAFANKNTVDSIANFPYNTVFSNYLLGYNPDTAWNNKKSNSHATNGNSWLYTFLHNRYEQEYKAGKIKFNYIKNGIDSAYLFGCLSSTGNTFRPFEYSSIKIINSIESIVSQISSVFLGLIFIVTAVIIFIIIYKMIDRNKQLIGILKANGYESWKINVSLVLSIITPLLLFSIFGSVLAFLLSKSIIYALSNMFALSYITFAFNLVPTLLIVTIPIFVLVIINLLLGAYLLKTPALRLISNNWAKRKYNFRIGYLFSLISAKINRKVSYRNKLLITNTFRTSGKMALIMVTSVFAITLLLFSFASSGLVNNMLGLQFASIDYKYGSDYNFDNDVKNNFFYQNQPIYKTEEISQIKSEPSLYMPIEQALEDAINNQSDPHAFVNLRYGYITGSQLNQIYNLINNNITKLPVNFQNEWNDFNNTNRYFIDYLTNDHGKKNSDLIITFGLLPYNKEFENPYTTLKFNSAHYIYINSSDNKVYYNNDTNKLEGLSEYAAKRTVLGINQDSANYLKVNFKNTNFNTFASLKLQTMENSSSWLDQKFISIRNDLITKLNIKDYANSSVRIIPMIGSTAAKIPKVTDGGDGNDIGQAVVYQYQGLDHQNKYIIGVIYDGSTNLLSNNILMPQSWLNYAILGTNNINLDNNLANAKFSNLNSNELQNYLPIFSSKNDYNVDLLDITNSSYLQQKGLQPSLTAIYDVSSIKKMIVSQQYTFQSLLLIFAVFSVILSFMIIIIITNINVRDNLILINVLKSLGYSSLEISYIFLTITIPLLIIFGLLSVYIAPVLTLIVANALTQFASIAFPVVFKWWYFALSLLIAISIYLFSFIITWKVNVKSNELMKLTK